MILYERIDSASDARNNPHHVVDIKAQINEESKRSVPSSPYISLDLYNPLDLSSLVPQLPFSIELILSTSEPLYQIFLSYADEIESLIDVIGSDNLQSFFNAHLMDGLIAGMMARYLNIPDYQHVDQRHTDWVDDFMAECFPASLKLLEEAEDEVFIQAGKWQAACRSDLHLKDTVSTTPLQLAYLNLLIICEMTLYPLTESEDEVKEIRVVYGDEGQYYRDIAYMSMIGIYNTTFQSPTMKVKGHETLLQIFERLYHLEETGGMSYQMAKYLIASITDLLDHSDSYWLNLPIGDSRAELFNSIENIHEGLVALFHTYIVDVLYQTYENTTLLKAQNRQLEEQYQQLTQGMEDLDVAKIQQYLEDNSVAIIDRNKKRREDMSQLAPSFSTPYNDEGDLVPYDVDQADWILIHQDDWTSYQAWLGEKESVEKLDSSDPPSTQGGE